MNSCYEIVDRRKPFFQLGLLFRHLKPRAHVDYELSLNESTEVVK